MDHLTLELVVECQGEANTVNEELLVKEDRFPRDVQADSKVISYWISSVSRERHASIVISHNDEEFDRCQGEDSNQNLDRIDFAHTDLMGFKNRTRSLTVEDRKLMGFRPRCCMPIGGVMVVLGKPTSPVPGA